MYPSRPPITAPSAPKNTKSSTSFGVKPREEVRAFLLPKYHTNPKPTTYINPYQWIGKGPKRIATGSICGYGIIELIV